MEWIAAVTAVALVEYMVFSLRVGSARGTYNVPAPAISGNEIFERHFRVHQNTLEQLIVFIPAMWIFGNYVNASVAAGLGLVFVIGRAIYAITYVQDPTRRTIGFVMGFLVNVVLVLGSIGGAIRTAM